MTPSLHTPAGPPLVLRRLVLETGHHTVSQTLLAKRTHALRAALGQEPLGQLVEQCFSASGIDARHLELMPDLEALPPKAAARASWQRATLDLCVRCVRPILSDASLSQPPALLLLCDPPGAGLDFDPAAASLAGRLANALGLPTPPHGPDYLRVYPANDPGAALLFARRLLRTARVKDVLLVAVSSLGSASSLSPLPERPTITRLLQRCTPSDAAAALLLSLRGDSKSLLHIASVEEEATIYHALGEQTWRAPAASPDRHFLQRPRPGSPADSHAALGRLRHWAEHELGRSRRPFITGGPLLPLLLALRCPRPSASLRLARGLFRQHGNLGASAPFFALASLFATGALQEELRIISLQRGPRTRQLCLTGLRALPAEAQPSRSPDASMLTAFSSQSL